MDVKKKNFFDNLRLKAKQINLKKPGKKPLAKQGKRLAYRRSISVPDLRFVQGEELSAESILTSAGPDGGGIGFSPGISDSDSVGSYTVPDGPLFADKLTVPVPRPRTRVSPDYSAVNRTSAPVETLAVYDEVDEMVRNMEAKGNFNPEAMYAQVDKLHKKKPPQFTFDMASPTWKSFESGGHSSSPKPVVKSSSLTGALPENQASERIMSVAAVLARAHSFGDQMNLYEDLKSARPGKGTPPAIRENASGERMSLNLDNVGSPLDSGDHISADSACDTPSEEQVNVPWTDSEGLDQELFSPLMMKELLAEDHLHELGQAEDGPEEAVELTSEMCENLEEMTQELCENSTTNAGPDVPAPVPFQRYLLCITLKYGKNLVIKDRRSGSSDPYVKFKLEGKQFYKSKVVYKNLNPRWNESFTYPLRDREHAVEVRVYDKNRTADEFMGASSIGLKNLELYKTYEMELCLDDPKSKEDHMGVIVVDACLMFRDATIKRSPRWAPRKNKQKAMPSPRPAEMQRSQQRNQMWTGVLAITLVEGQDLPHHGQGDVYVRYRLGDQKYKSKNLCIQANPQWRERFDFNQFGDNQEPLQVEVCSKRGRKAEESWGIFEIDLSRLPINERQLYTHVLDPGKGRLVFLVTLRPCWGVSISDIETAMLEKADERETIMEKFSLKNSYRCVGDVGFLQVKVIKANDLQATDLNGKSNPFCIIELGNSKLQTHTIYKTVNPEWSKALTFPIKDIHDVVELTVMDENGDKSANFLGKVAVPLLTVQNDQQISLFLKKEDLSGLSKGTITLTLEVIYNKVRAGIRTFQPKEEKFTDENLKFSKKVLARNIYRVRKISTAILNTLQYIKSCFQWESTQRSVIAFLIFLVTVWNCEIFMLPLFLLLLIGWNYFQLGKGKTSSNQDLVNMGIGDEDEEDEKEAAKKGLMDKIHMVQEVVLAVQNVLEEIANIGERIKNIFNWSVPFLSLLACLVLFVAAMLLYFFPLRYILLIWGINKFTKKLRNPYTIDNNEVLDFLERVPSDVQKVQYSALRAPTSQSQPRRRK
ncbi:multiple C2 and transmembrane domain-containing protein 2 isoform 1-T3 [Synchiropus picturatus]